MRTAKGYIELTIVFRKIFDITIADEQAIPSQGIPDDTWNDIMNATEVAFPSIEFQGWQEQHREINRIEYADSGAAERVIEEITGWDVTPEGKEEAKLTKEQKKAKEVKDVQPL